MNKFLRNTLFLLLASFSITLFAQPANDLCLDATPINNLNNNCISFNVEDATFNIANGSCAESPGSVNLWYSFVAQGSGITITATGYQGEAYVTLLEFNFMTCEFSSAVQLACGTANNNDVAIDYNALIPGNTYYIIVNNQKDVPGNAEFCIDNPVTNVPPNDDSCSPITIGDNCVPSNGTTIDANLDFGNLPGGCTPLAEVGVFYEFTLSGSNNSVDIDVTDVNLSGDVTVVLGQWISDCNGNLTVLDIYCGTPGTELIQFSGLTPGETYVVYVATSAADQGTFGLAVCGFGPPPGCALNDNCNSAEAFPTIDSDNTTFTCLSGCNIAASPEPGLGGCSMATEEVVWFTFDTDNDATLASLSLNSNDIDQPTIQLFGGSCSGLTLISDCVTGGNGYAELVNIAVMPNMTYFIAVSNSYGNGGTFDLCILTLDDPSSCVVNAGLSIVSTSLGSPFEGPYKPAEEIEFCYSINSYDATSAANGCQWLQGIIPIFGCAWDDTSFDSEGQPINITVPLTSNFGAVVGWYTDVTYNHDTDLKSLGDFDGDGNLDLCHYTEPSCPNSGISSGDILPGGWFFYKYGTGSGYYPGNGHPNVEFGDGSGCSVQNVTWTVCFKLTTKDIPECETCDDASVKFYTTSDGETGDYSGTGSTCSNDIPQTKKGILDCCIGPELLQPLEETICSGETSALELLCNTTPATYVYTAINNSSISGAASGSGQYITQTLVNNSTIIETQVYEVIPYNDAGCAGEPEEVYIYVLPEINVDAGPDIPGCAQGEFTLGGTPTASGGAGSPYIYDWGDPSVDNVANPTATPNVTTLYVVTVTDANGCTNTDDIQLDISPSFDIDITGDTTLCASASTTLTGVPLGGTPNHTYLWEGIGVYNTTSSLNYTNAAGLYNLTLTVTDANGCTGANEVGIEVKSSPIVFLFPDPDPAVICPGNTATIVVASDGSDDTYSWNGPNGAQSGSTLVVDQGGDYLLTVTNNFGCVTLEDITVTVSEVPFPDIIYPIGICEGAEETLLLTEDYASYLWSDGSSTPTIDAGPGTYAVTVTNEAGCTGEAEITIQEYASPEAEIGGSTSFCVGSSTTLSANTGMTTYLWTDAVGNIIGNGQTLDVTSSATITLTVTNSAGCKGTASVQVEQKDFLEPNVIGDLTLCPGDSSVLDAGVGYDSYIWNTNETTQFIKVNAAGDYAVTVTDASGCTGETIKNVSINVPPVPTLSTSLNKNSICPDGSLEISVNESYISYLWNDNTTNPTITVNAAGTYSVTVTDVEGCTGLVSIEITEDTPPQPSYTGELQFCVGGFTSITPEDGYSIYEIDLENNGSIDITNMDNAPIILNTPGQTKIIVTDANGCKGEVVVEVSNYDVPMPMTTLDEASFCSGGSVTISLTENYPVILWKNPDGSDAGTTQSIIADQAGQYNVEIVDVNGCTGSTSMIVIEATELSPAITGLDKTCDGESVILDAGAGYNMYQWSTNETSQSIEVTAGTYSVTVFDGGSCSGESEFTVSNFETPELTIQAKAIVCNNIDSDEGVVLNFNDFVTGAVGVWEDFSGSGVDLLNLDNVSFENIPSGFYIFKYTTTTAVAPCENVSGAIEIEVKECLCPSVEINNIDDICLNGTTIDLDTYKVTAEDGSWSIVDGAGGNPLSGSIFNPQNGNYGQYIVRFTLTETKVDCPEYQDKVINVIEPANAGTPELPISICYNSNQIILLNDLLQNEQVGGIWTEISIENSSDNAFDGASGQFSTVAQNVGTYLFQYTVAGVSPCSDDNAVVEVKVVENPIAKADDDKILTCNMTSVELVGGGEGIDLSYHWSESKGGVIDNPQNPTIVVENAGEYLLEVTDANSCIDTDTTIVEMNTNYPILSYEAKDPNCANSNNGIIDIFVTNGVGPFEYSIDGGLTWEGNQGFLNLEPGEYIVQVRDVNGCVDEEVVTIQEPSLDKIDLGADIELFNESEVQLEFDYNGDINDIVEAIWTLNESIICEGSDCLTFTLPLESGEYEVCVTIVTSEGCSAEDCISIRNKTILSGYVPNAFSPNNDNTNEVFFVQGDKDLKKVNYMRIYDRWGESVFENEDFLPNDPNEGWDGTFKGKMVNPGVYVYRIAIEFENGETQKFDGDVTLLK